MSYNSCIKKYGATHKRIIELGEEIEANLLELYQSLKGTGLNARLHGEGKYKHMTTYTTKITESDDGLRIRTIDREEDEVYTIKIEPECTYKGKWFWKREIENSGEPCIRFKGGELYILFRSKKFRSNKYFLRDFFKEYADDFPSETLSEEGIVFTIIKSMIELPGRLMEHFSYLEGEADKFSAMTNKMTDKMRSDTALITKLFSNTWFEEDKEKFKELFKKLSDVRKKEVLESLLGYFTSGENPELEEWLSKEYGEMSRKVARGMVVEK